jgi:hypothetical protein
MQLLKPGQAVSAAIWTRLGQHFRVQVFCHPVQGGRFFMHQYCSEE